MVLAFVLSIAAGHLLYERVGANCLPGRRRCRLAGGMVGAGRDHQCRDVTL